MEIKRRNVDGNRIAKRLGGHKNEMKFRLNSRLERYLYEFARKSVSFDSLYSERVLLRPRTRISYAYGPDVENVDNQTTTVVRPNNFRTSMFFRQRGRPPLPGYCTR